MANKQSIFEKACTACVAPIDLIALNRVKDMLGIKAPNGIVRTPLIGASHEVSGQPLPLF